MFTSDQWIFIIFLGFVLTLSISLTITAIKIFNKKSLNSTKKKSKTDALQAYLESEVDKTSQQLEYTKEHAPSKNVSGLQLRLELLNFELAYLPIFSSSEKAESTINWDDVNIYIYKILKANSFCPNTNLMKHALENEDEDHVPSENILAQQSKTIEHLKSFINNLLTQMDDNSLPNPELDSHFKKLEESKIELEQCVMILEDENGFLRNQISFLLKEESNQ